MSNNKRSTRKSNKFPKERGNNGRSRKSEFSTDDKRANSSNDPSWYAVDSSLLRDSASVPFSWAVGTPIKMNNTVLQNVANYEDYVTIPGLQTEYLWPAVGFSPDASSPLNIAANSLYAFVRHANSGHSNYDAPDLMLYVTAMSQVYSYINFLQRAYGVCTLYSQRNRYMPLTLLRAMGIDADDVLTNLADFRYGINLLINKAASFAVPANMTYFNRQAMVYQNIYTEGTSIKDQLYMYCPAGFYKYEINSDGSGSLKIKDYLVFGPQGTIMNDNYKSLDDLLQYGEELIRPLILSEDLNIMSGDILKAYGPNGIIKLAALPVEYTIMPVFDIGVLEQMKNATVLDTQGIVKPDITQDATHGFLISKPGYDGITEIIGSQPWISNSNAAAYECMAENRILTTTSAETTPELVMESTRLMSVVTDLKRTAGSTPNSKNVVEGSIHCGSEMVVGCLLWYFVYDAVAKQQLERYQPLKYGQNFYIEDDDYLLILGYIRAMGLKTHFRFSPAMHVIVSKAGSTEGAYQVADGFFFYDVDNYAVLSPQDLQRMHEAAIVNLLHVPSIAKL